jgi:hypothetical protein
VEPSVSLPGAAFPVDERSFIRTGDSFTRQLGQLDVGDGADVEEVGAGDVAGAPCCVEVGVLPGARVCVWPGDGLTDREELADRDGLAVRVGLGDRDGVRPGDGLTVGTELVGVGPGMTVGSDGTGPAVTGRTRM